MGLGDLIVAPEAVSVDPRLSCDEHSGVFAVGTKGPDMRRSLSLFVVLVVAALLVACNGEDGDATPTSTQTLVSPSTTATATATVTPTTLGAAESVEDIDFTDPAVIGPLIDHFGGGEIEPERIQYLDVTGDGEDDAFVIVASGGTAGDVGAVLVAVEDGAATVAGYVETGGLVELRFPEVGGGLVVTTEGVWEPGDAECCPSKLRESTYEWVDGAFVLRDEQVGDSPDVD